MGLFGLLETHRPLFIGKAFKNTNGSYVVLLYNVGNETAENVRLELVKICGDENIQEEDIKEVFPVESIEPGGSISFEIKSDTELPFIQEVRMVWDASERKNVKELVPIVRYL